MKRYVVRHASNPDAPAWETAECLTDFRFPWEVRAVPSTEFRALWSDSRLHFRFDCTDGDLVLGDGADAKQRVIGSDRVEIFLAPSLDLTPYYGLEMDPRGEVLDYAARYHRNFDWDWKCDGLAVEARICAGGYRVEGSIPLQTLRSLGVIKPESASFFTGVFRAEFSHAPGGAIHEGWVAWVDPATETPDFHVPTAFGVFELAAS